MEFSARAWSSARYDEQEGTHIVNTTARLPGPDSELFE